MSMDPDQSSPAVSAPSPIPTAVKELLALFDGPLSSVSFPDVDGKALREQAASVEAAVADVEAAAQVWAEAKRAVDARLEVLLQKAQRALAYARVYAEDKPELDAALAALVVPKWGDPRGQRPATGPEVASARKRGRPKKNGASGDAPKSEPLITLLPGGGPAEPQAAGSQAAEPQAAEQQAAE